MLDGMKILASLSILMFLSSCFFDKDKSDDDSYSSMSIRINNVSDYSVLATFAGRSDRELLTINLMKDEYIYVYYKKTEGLATVEISNNQIPYYAKLVINIGEYIRIMPLNGKIEAVITTSAVN